MIIAEFKSMRAAAAISRDAHALAAAAAVAALSAGSDAAILAAVAAVAADHINNSEGGFSPAFNQVEAFHGSHKCHAETMQVGTHMLSHALYIQREQSIGVTLIDLLI